MNNECQSVKSKPNNPHKISTDDAFISQPKTISLHENSYIGNNLNNILSVKGASQLKAVPILITPSIENLLQVINTDSHITITRTDDDSSRKIYFSENIKLQQRVIILKEKCPNMRLKDKAGMPYTINQLEAYYPVILYTRKEIKSLNVDILIWN